MISGTGIRRSLKAVTLVAVLSSSWACAPAGDDASASAMSASAEMETMKAYLVNGFERAKAWDLSIAEAMPDSAMGWGPTENVRGFAAQVVHAANNGFIGDAMFGEAGPQMDEGITDKAGLIEGVGSTYDWLISRLDAMAASDLEAEVDFFGQSMPRWRVGLFALEHAMWTRGQLVPYLHAHGVEVPPNQLF